jgi:hypothetical protein
VTEEFFIGLGNGGVAVVDAEDAEAVAPFHWHRQSKGYVATMTGPGGRKMLLLHDLLMAPPIGFEVDHVDGDPLNNRRRNLRIATHQANQVNRKRLHPRNKSGVRGVYRGKNGIWRACIMVNRRQIHLGSFVDLNEAAEARRAAELHYWGEQAPIPIPEVS